MVVVVSRAPFITIVRNHHYSLGYIHAATQTGKQTPHRRSSGLSAWNAPSYKEYTFCYLNQQLRKFGTGCLRPKKVDKCIYAYMCLKFDLSVCLYDVIFILMFIAVYCIMLFRLPSNNLTSFVC